VGDHSKFAVFILSHGRAHTMSTHRALKNCGYTGRTYILIDNEDPDDDAYREKFGAENVLVFDKEKIAQTFDLADNTGDRRAVVFARNAAVRAARDLGLDYHLQLDDDYTTFTYRYVDDGGVLRGIVIRSLDGVFKAMLDFLDTLPPSSVIAFCQGGDALGGIRGGFPKEVKRKAMNSLFIPSTADITFVGRINEDVNTYVTEGSRGRIFLTILRLQLDQTDTQEGSGGMTGIYEGSGTYVKSFYTVMMHPSSVHVSIMPSKYQRYHHHIDWGRTVPKIVSGVYRKPR